MRLLDTFLRPVAWAKELPALAMLLCLAVPAFAAQDPRIKAIDDFLWTRTQANDVIEYTYMTDRLKDSFRGKRKVKIRHESSILLTFRYDPGKLEIKDGGKGFEVDIVGVWKNLNEHLIGEIDERDTFIQTPRGWRADRIKFGEERPTAKAIVDGFDAPKEYRDSIRVLKVVMRAWAEGDGDTAMRYTSVDLGQQFRSPDELKQILAGPADPHHAAYAIRRITNAGRDKVDFDVDCYAMNKGDPRPISSKVKVGVKRFDSTWLVDSWTPENSNIPTP